MTARGLVGMQTRAPPSSSAIAAMIESAASGAVARMTVVKMDQLMRIGAALCGRRAACRQCDRLAGGETASRPRADQGQALANFTAPTGETTTSPTECVRSSEMPGYSWVTPSRSV